MSPKIGGNGVNLRELAQHLGLSQTTVSRALNGYPEVGEETRRRVMEAARRHDYRPNPSARRLATGRAGMIGVLFPFDYGLTIDPHFAEFLAGVAGRVAETDSDVLIVPSLDGAVRASRLRAIDALVVSGPAVRDPRVPMLQRMGVPFVVHGRTEAPGDFAFLDVDNEGGFRRATEMLADLGHRRIALVNGPTALTFARDRERGWRAGLAARGLPAEGGFVAQGDMSEENGYWVTRDLLQTEARPTAVLCSSMLLALGSCRAIRDAGLTVGADISVVAHDDRMPSIKAETMVPPLTTTTSAIRDAGRRITEIALALADGGDPADYREVWPVDIVFRESAAPPRPDAPAG
jgi:LacI family transcriptional regulator